MWLLNYLPTFKWNKLDYKRNTWRTRWRHFNAIIILKNILSLNYPWNSIYEKFFFFFILSRHMVWFESTIYFSFQLTSSCWSHIFKLYKSNNNRWGKFSRWQMHLHLRTEGDIPDNNKFSCAETFIHNCMHHANLIKILQKHFQLFLSLSQQSRLYRLE